MVEVIGGVDTHAAVHCAAVIDANGRLLGVREFEANQAGYRSLICWMRTRGQIRSVGVEGTGAYGAGLARYLHAEGAEVLEVARPDRRTRRRWGKSDPIDAEAAARSVLAGTATVSPKGQDGLIEAIRALRVARNGALKAKTAATNTLRSMIITAPEELRRTLDVSAWHPTLVASCSGLRPDMDRLEDPVHSTKLALRSIALRARALSEEVRALDRELRALIERAAPVTLGAFGLGTDTVGALLVTVG